MGVDDGGDSVRRVVKAVHELETQRYQECDSQQNVGPCGGYVRPGDEVVRNAGADEDDAADQNAGGQMFQTNLIQPEPCQFLSPDLPACSVIRPTLSAGGGPMATVQSFVADGLFIGQDPHFLQQLMELASEAEAAHRENEH